MRHNISKNIATKAALNGSRNTLKHASDWGRRNTIKFAETKSFKKQCKTRNMAVGSFNNVLEL